MSAMSEIHAEAMAATRCASIGCAGHPPAVAMVWAPVFDGDAPEVESVCAECAEGYGRRPWVAARVTFLPFESVS